MGGLGGAPPHAALLGQDEVGVREDRHKLGRLGGLGQLVLAGVVQLEAGRAEEGRCEPVSRDGLEAPQGGGHCGSGGEPLGLDRGAGPWLDRSVGPGLDHQPRLPGLLECWGRGWGLPLGHRGLCGAVLVTEEHELAGHHGQQRQQGDQPCHRDGKGVTELGRTGTAPFIDVG